MIFRPIGSLSALFVLVLVILLLYRSQKLIKNPVKCSRPHSNEGYPGGIKYTFCSHRSKKIIITHPHFVPGNAHTILIILNKTPNL